MSSPNHFCQKNGAGLVRRAVEQPSTHSCFDNRSIQIRAKITTRPHLSQRNGRDGIPCCPGVRTGLDNQRTRYVRTPIRAESVPVAGRRVQRRTGRRVKRRLVGPGDRLIGVDWRCAFAGPCRDPLN